MLSLGEDISDYVLGYSYSQNLVLMGTILVILSSIQLRPTLLHEMYPHEAY